MLSLKILSGITLFRLHLQVRPTSTAFLPWWLNDVIQLHEAGVNTVMAVAKDNSKKGKKQEPHT